MKKLKAKLKKKGGFTLVEMLIVVAIIAILIAISIPMISTTLDKARKGVDDGNERSAMSMAEAYYLTNYEDLSKKTESFPLYYTVTDKHQGKITEDKSAADANNFKYGQAAGGKDSTAYDHRDKGVVVTMTPNGEIESVEWKLKTELGE